jgi:hypothetical protein
VPKQELDINPGAKVGIVPQLIAYDRKWPV